MRTCSCLYRAARPSERDGGSGPIVLLLPDPWCVLPRHRSLGGLCDQTGAGSVGTGNGTETT